MIFTFCFSNFERSADGIIAFNAATRVVVRTIRGRRMR
jgi:hypothetical protein